MSVKVALYREKERLKRSFWRARFGSCTVLLYHRIIDLDFDPQGLCVSMENFNAHIEHFKKSHVFLSIDEFSDILSSGKTFPRKSLLISFDDGYADNLSNAIPIMESHGVKGVFYIATNNIGSKDLFWWDELDLLFKNVTELDKGIVELKKKNDIIDTDSLYDFYLGNCRRAASLEERQTLMRELRQYFKIQSSDLVNYEFLSGEKLLQLANSKSADIGAHTVNHLSLGHLSSEDQFSEISSSVNVLSRLLSRKIEHFSYPYGERSDFNDETIRICKELNLKSAAANYAGYVTVGNNVFSFPRFVVRNDRSEVLQNKLKEIL